MPDPDIVELELEFQGLSISVRGPAGSAASFVRGLESNSVSANSSGFQQSPVSGHHHASAAGSFSGLSPVASAPSVAASTSSESRAVVLSSFPEIPQDLLRLANRLSGSRLSGPQRVQRAWTCGCWAGAVLAGRVPSPNQAEQLELANRYYCVLSCARLSEPRVFTSSRQFFSAVGRLEGSDTVCQAFPSESEAKIYFRGAGVPFPADLN